MGVHFDWNEEFQQYLDALNPIDRAKLRAAIKRIEETGIQEAIKKQRVKKLRDNLYEIRARTKENTIRSIYFQIQGESYFITHGFNKKTDKTPKKEIMKGIRLRAIFFKGGSEYERNE